MERRSLFHAANITRNTITQFISEGSNLLIDSEKTNKKIAKKINEVTGATVTCTLIGERPGLITATSMSAYIAYKATVGMPEARRTVFSNIHAAGTNPAEAGAHIAEIIKIMLEKKASGTDLKL